MPVEPSDADAATVGRPPPRIAGDAFSVFGATVIALAIGFATTIVVARLLGPSGRGLLGVGFSVATIAVAATSLGVPIATTYYASRRPRLIPALVGNALLYGLLLLVGLLAAALAFASLSSWPGVSDAHRFWLLVAVLTWSMYLEFVTANVLRGRSRYRRLNSLLVLSRITGLIVTLLLVAVLDLGVNGALVALAAGSLVYSAGGLAYEIPRGLGLARHVFAASVRYGWRVQIGRLIQIGNGRLDVLILSALAPLSAVGVYVAAQVVAELALLVPSAIGFVAMPAIARGGEDGPDAARAVRMSGTLSLVGVIGVALIGPALILVGYGSAFKGALEPLFILLPGIWLLGIGSVVADVMRGRGRPGVPSLLAAVAIVVTITLDLVLIPPFEEIGAAIASTCAYAVYGISSLFVLGRMERVNPASLLLAKGEELRAAAAVPRRFVRRPGRQESS